MSESEKESKSIQRKKETPLREGVEPTREGLLFLPPTDICETNEAIVLTADMPGVKPDGVEVTLEKNVLTVHGTVADAHLCDGAVYTEYESGNYQRSFSISNEIDRDGIEARMSNGVLTLMLPKTKPSRRMIDVQTA